MAKQAPLAKQHTDPWSVVVHQIRTNAEQDRWRASQSVLKRIPLWPQVAAVWMDVGPAIPHLAQPDDCPTNFKTIEQRRVWVWQEVWPQVDIAFRMMADRIDAGDYDVLMTFRQMTEAMLLFPDGTIHRVLKRQLEDADKVAESLAAMKTNEAALRAANANLELAKLFQQPKTP